MEAIAQAWEGFQTLPAWQQFAWSAGTFMVLMVAWGIIFEGIFPTWLERIRVRLRDWLAR